MNKNKKQNNNPPKRPLLEEIGNSITHGIGAGLSIAGFILMLIKSTSTLEIISSVIYFIGLFIPLESYHLL